ncbi:MAG: helix-turn-helix domain-containing protein [bacterium]
MKQDLIQLGFSSNEADVYLAMIDLGETGAGEIIKKTSLHRNIVYETLDKLIAKKLVTKVTKKNVAQFLLNDPDRILDEQKHKLELASKLVPSLINKANIKQEIVIYEGLEGFQTFSMNYIQRMAENATLYVLGAVGDLWFELMGSQHRKFEKIRLNKKITFKMVEYHQSEMDKAISDAGRLYSVRVIPQNLENPANVLIWDDHIALQTLIEPYSVIEIKNAALAKSYLNYFNLLWKQGQDI